MINPSADIQEFNRLFYKYYERRNLLFQNYESIKRDLYLKEYSGREIFFNLYSTIESSQNLYNFYSKLNLEDFSEEEKDFLNRYINYFEEQSYFDHISYIKENHNISTVEYDAMRKPAEEVINKLHLLEPYIQGMSKMTYSLYNKFVDIMLIKNYGYGALMDKSDVLKVDLDRLLMDRTLLMHMIFHEVGHSEVFQKKGVARKPQNVYHLDYFEPDSIAEEQNIKLKEEYLADFFAAVVFSIYDIPITKVYSKFITGYEQNQEIKALIPTYVNERKRAELLDNVFSALKQNLKVGTRWNVLAEYYKHVTDLSFDDIPSIDDINNIYASVSNRDSQLNLLKIKFPKLFEYTKNFLFPPKLMVQPDLIRLDFVPSKVYTTLDLGKKFAECINMGPFGCNDDFSVEMLQDAYDRSRTEVPATRLVHNSFRPYVRASYVTSNIVPYEFNNHLLPTWSNYTKPGISQFSFGHSVNFNVSNVRNNLTTIDNSNLLLGAVCLHLGKKLFNKVSHPDFLNSFNMFKKCKSEPRGLKEKMSLTVKS